MNELELLAKLLKGELSTQELVKAYYEATHKITADNFISKILLRISEIYKHPLKEDFFLYTPQNLVLEINHSFVETLDRNLIVECLNYRKDINVLNCILKKLEKRFPDIKLLRKEIEPFLSMPLFLTDIVEVGK